MPLYLFRCPTCGFAVEVLQAYAAAPPRCPITDNACCGTPMARQPSAPAVRILDPPTTRTTRSREGFKITTTDTRPRKERA